MQYCIVIFVTAKITVKTQLCWNNCMLFIVSKLDEELRKRNEVKLFEILMKRRNEVREMRILIWNLTHLWKQVILKSIKNLGHAMTCASFSWNTNSVKVRSYLLSNNLSLRIKQGRVRGQPDHPSFFWNGLMGLL